MFKVLFFIVRNPEVSVAEFRHHYDNVHVPLTRNLLPQILEHRRNYPVLHELAPSGDEPPLQWDSISEMWFADKNAYEEMLSLLEEPAIKDAIKSDEHLFINREKCMMVIVDEVIGAGQPA